MPRPGPHNKKARTLTQIWKNQSFTISHAADSPFVPEGLRTGSCVLQPPGIRHREVRHSDDMQLIEITSPAEFATRDSI